MRVGYLGPKGSFTHQAAKQLFPLLDQTLLRPVDTIPKLFEELAASGVDVSVVPFENSTNGLVEMTLDSMAKYTREGLKDPRLQFRIKGETRVRVKHCLAVLPSAENPPPDMLQQADGILKPVDLPEKIKGIKTLYTHPQAWTQCDKFLAHYFPDVEVVQRVDADSTSTAAIKVSEEEPGTSAAICSALAAYEYGLDILADGIQDTLDNTTFFFAIAHKDVEIRTAEYPIAPKLAPPDANLDRILA